MSDRLYTFILIGGKVSKERVDDFIDALRSTDGVTDTKTKFEVTADKITLEMLRERRKGSPLIYCYEGYREQFDELRMWCRDNGLSYDFHVGQTSDNLGDVEYWRVGMKTPSHWLVGNLDGDRLIWACKIEKALNEPYTDANTLRQAIAKLVEAPPKIPRLELPKTGLAKPKKKR